MKDGGTLRGFTGKLLREIYRRLLLKQYYDLKTDGAKRVKLERRLRLLLANNVLQCTNRARFIKRTLGPTLMRSAIRRNVKLMNVHDSKMFLPNWTFVVEQFYRKHNTIIVDVR